MKFRPLHDRIVIRRIEGEEKTKGGIIIPDTAREKPQEGEVVAVGPGARARAASWSHSNSKRATGVLFGKWSGTEVKIDGEDARPGRLDRSLSPRGPNSIIRWANA